MIVFVGDLHGDIRPVCHLSSSLTPDDVIIQVGDFGVYHSVLTKWAERKLFGTPPMVAPVYFIEGNHENFRIVRDYPKAGVTEVAEGLFFIPRGEVLTIQGVRMGFLGGGESLNMADKRMQGSWSSDERITEAQVKRLCDNAAGEPLDLLVTHTPPSSAIAGHWPAVDLGWWGLPPGWQDVSSQMVERAHQSLGCPPLICGHMHRSVLTGQVRMLDINEVYEWREPNIAAA